VTYKTLPGGWAGTDATVALMGQMAMGKYGARSAKIRALAINIINGAGVPNKDDTAAMVAIHNWVRDTIRYVRDVVGQETLCYPEEIAFNSKAGDCDDLSMLDAALLGAVGIPSRFITMGVTPVKYDHVYLQAKPKSTWISLDPIMRGKPAGWEVPAHVVKVRKVFPENTPGEMSMGRNGGVNGPLDWYVGYQGGGFAHSHLSPAPDPRTGAGPGQPVHAPQADSPYVIMDSFLDQDAPIEQISRDMPAFPQQGLTQQRPPQQRDPRADAYQAKRLSSRTSAAMVGARVRADEQHAMNVEHAAANPMHGLEGPNGLMGPDELAGMGFSNGIDRQMPRPNMQRPALAQAPEGIDSMFTRPNMVLRTDKGQTVVYSGLYSLGEKPPVRPYTGMAGLGHTRSGGMPGMGMMPARSISGPGVAELAGLEDVGDDVIAADPVPAVSGAAKLAAFAAIGLGLYLMFKKKG
jgi:hypothetical protein